jgi:hypothetical protein
VAVGTTVLINIRSPTAFNLRSIVTDRKKKKKSTVVRKKYDLKDENEPRQQKSIISHVSAAKKAYKASTI